VGIYNIRRRLQLRYNGEAGLTIDSAPEEGTIISIKIPYRNKGVLG
jgi:sensor histidine kinase YesM